MALLAGQATTVEPEQASVAPYGVCLALDRTVQGRSRGPAGGWRRVSSGPGLMVYAARESNPPTARSVAVPND
jgi:hypothetical protein